MLVKIFFFCCQSASNMAFRFVDVQHFSCLLGQSGVNLHEPVGHVLMYCTFAHAKLSGRLSDCGIVVNNIIGNADRTLFNIILQR